MRPPGEPAYRPSGWAAHIIPSRKDAQQRMSSHAPVQYALLTLLIVLFRIDPLSAQAVTAAIAIWEVANHPRPAR
jgi:hypothetical protein